MSQSRLHLEEPAPKQAIQPADAWILKLPIELLIAITKYLPMDDVSHLRLVCKYLDTLLFDRFASRYFSRLYILPTTNAVATLTQIANTRLKPYVQDLHFWPSVYQHGKDGRSIPISGTGRGYQYRRITRIVEENDLPYPCPVKPWQQVANDTVDFMKSGCLEKQLVAVLNKLQINGITIRRRPEGRHLNLKEASRLKQESGMDPMRTIHVPVWEYAHPDMMTCISNTVLAAVSASPTRTSLHTLILDQVQDDQMQVLNEENASRFSALKCLTISIGLSSLLKTKTEDLESSNLSTFLNHLPGLLTLEMPCHYRDEDPVILGAILRSSRPKHIRTLRLGILESPMPELIPFLTAMRSKLRNLKLEFQVEHVRNVFPTPWKDWFLQLRHALTLEKLFIEMDDREFEAFGEYQIAILLELMAKKVPIDWKIEEPNDDNFSDDNCKGFYLPF